MYIPHNPSKASKARVFTRPDLLANRVLMLKIRPTAAMAKDTQNIVFTQLV